MVFCSKPYRAAPSSGAGLTSFRHVHVLSVDIALLEMISYCLLIICFVKSVTKPDILTSLSTTPNSRPLSFSMLAGMTRIEDYESMEHLGASRYLLTFVSAAGERYREFLLAHQHSSLRMGKVGLNWISQYRTAAPRIHR